MRPMLNCPACQAGVSAAAESCPHCGHPFRPAKKSVASGVFWGLVAFFIGLPLVIGLGFLLLGGALVGVGQFAEERQKSQRVEAEEKAAAEVRAANAREEETRRQLEADRLAQESTPEGIATKEAAIKHEQEQARLAAIEAEKEAKILEAQREEQRTRPARERAARVLAFHFLQASNGVAEYQYQIGRRYLKGDGLPKDEALARAWLSKSAAQGDSQAVKALGELAK